MAEWSIVLLGPEHERGAFCCGKAPLDSFIQQQARQHSKKNVSRTYVALRTGEKVVLGFYTCCTGAIDVSSLPEEERKRLPRHPVPTVHLARMAVDQSVKGQGLGRTLLFHFFQRALDTSGDVGVHAVDVWAKDDQARSFYLKYGFRELLDDHMHLVLPITTIEEIFKEAYDSD